MLNNVVIGRFINTDSSLHRQNALSKIISTIIYIIAVFANSNWYLFILLFAFTILLMLLSNVKLKLYFKSIYSLKILIISVLLINLLCGVTINDSLLSIIRLVLTVLYTTILTFTTPSSALTYGLEKLFKPLKIIGIPVEKLAFSITMAIRFIPMLLDQANTILLSMASRGIDYINSGIKGKIKAIKSLMIPLLTNSLRKADTLALSMELRLYSFKNKRTNIRIMRWSVYDTFMILLHLVLLLLSIKGDELGAIFNNFFL